MINSNCQGNDCHPVYLQRYVGSLNLALVVPGNKTINLQKYFFATLKKLSYFPNSGIGILNLDDAISSIGQGTKSVVAFFVITAVMFVVFENTVLENLF